METEIDALQLRIKVNSESANRKLDAFVKKISEIKSVLTGIDEDKMAALNMAMGSGVGATKPVQEIKKAADEGNTAMKTLKSSTTEVSDAAKSTGKSGAEEMERITQTVESTSVKMVSLKDGFKNLLSPLKKFGKLFGDVMRIAKYRMIRSVIKNITQGFSEGTKNLYEYSKSINGTFAEARDKVTTATAYLKNSIGAAFGGLYEMAAPVIDKIVDGVVEGLNYVNRMIAAISGKSTWTKAVKNLKQYNDEVKRTVLGIDEINKLNGDENNNSLYDFEEIKLTADEITDLTRQFEEIKDIAIAIGSAIAVWKLSSAFMTGIETLKTTLELVTAGITLSIAGIEFAYSGGKDLAFDVTNMKAWWKAAGGVLATAIGGTLIGTAINPGVGTVVGFAIGTTIGVMATIKGYVDGKYENSDIHKYFVKLNEDLDNLRNDSQTRLNALNDALDNLDNNEQKYTTGFALLDDIYSLETAAKTSDKAMTELQSKIKAFNDLELVDIKLEWDTVKQGINYSKEAVEDLMEAELREIKLQGYKDVLAEAYKNQALNSVALIEAQEKLNEVEKEMKTSEFGIAAGRMAMGNATREQIAWVEDLMNAQSNAKSTIEQLTTEQETNGRIIKDITKKYTDLTKEINEATKSAEAFSRASYLQSRTGLDSNTLAAMAATYHNLKKHANGGFPSQGSMFIANESGAEMVGTIGNRTAVANTGDITTAISDAVYQAFSSAGGNGGSITIQMMDESGNVRSEKYISAAQKRNLRDGKITLPVGV